jgi:hypothetical protein
MVEGLVRLIRVEVRVFSPTPTTPWAPPLGVVARCSPFAGKSGRKVMSFTSDPQCQRLDGQVCDELIDDVNGGAYVAGAVPCGCCDFGVDLEATYHRCCIA